MRILLIKLGAIGDVIQTAAAVKIYQQYYPEAQVDWVSGRQVSALVRSIGVANNVIEVDEQSFLSGSLLRRIRGLFSATTSIAMRTTSYDYVVIAYSDWRYSILGYGVRAQRRSRFKSHGARPSPIHHRNRVFEYWRLLSGNDDSPVDIVQAMSEVGDSILKASHSALLPSLPPSFVALAPGGANNILRTDGLRRWPIQYYRSLAKSLLAEGHAVVLVGGPGDSWVSESFSDLAVFDWIGKTNLTDLVHVFDHAEVVVTHDCGPMHMAAVTQAPLVALFGPTPANAFLPFSRPKTIILERGNCISCSPCYDGKNYADCTNSVCLESISVDEVLLAVKCLLHNEDIH